MAKSLKERITADLKQVKETGQLRTERVREIIRSAVAQVGTELKAGSGDMRSLVKDVFSSAIATVQEVGTEAKEEVTALVEGMVEGVSSSRQQAIAKTEAEVKRLQAQLTEQEEALEEQVESSLEGMREVGEQAPSLLKEQIEEAIAAIKNSEEASLLKRRYAQLQAQSAILRANLAARTETYHGRAQEYLDEAKNWYSQARPKAEVAKEQVDQKFVQIEEKIGEAGTALAKKETQVRQILSDLLRRASEVVEETDKPKRTTAKLPPVDEQEKL